MTDRLTTEQIVTQIEAGFSPHVTKAHVHDYGDKITFKVWSAEDGSHLFTVPDVSVYKLQIAHVLEDIIGSTRREVEDKVAGRFS